MHRRLQSRYWHGAWRGADGRLRLRSTKQTDRSKAMAVALEWERVDKKLGRGEMVENQVHQVIKDILDKVGEPAVDVPSIKTRLNASFVEEETTGLVQTFCRNGRGMRHAGRHHAPFLHSENLPPKHLGQRRSGSITPTRSRPMVPAPDQMRRRNVALIVETSVVYGRQILHGIAQYLKTHTLWSVFLDERELRAPPPDWLSHWRGDGVICRSTTPEWARIFHRRRLPVVDLNDLHLDLGLPRVGSDMQAIGRLGAEHLRERGFRHLAFCGFSGETWSEQRREGFAEAALGTVGAGSVYESPWPSLREHPWQEERNQIALWLQTLPRPVGIMACNDVRGQHVLEACWYVGAHVPDEVAVVGVDNAETFCDLCNPPLSSVMPDAERIGFDAAALLDRLMAGETAPSQDLLVKPLGVVTRQSSDVFAVEDALVARAVRFIREHACQRAKVADVLAEVHCSRSVLERRFRELLGHSPQAELRAVQLRRVQQLLAETDWTLARIAEAAGIEHPEYLSVLFKRQTGQTPGEFRKARRSEKPRRDV